jgi:excisionase family DNA binding protein
METLFSVKKTAEMLGQISPWTVYAWISQGRLKKTKIGSRTMIAQSEIERFIRDGQRKGEKQSGQAV